MFQGEPGQMPGRGIDSAFLDQPTTWKMYLPWLVEETWARAWAKKNLEFLGFFHQGKVLQIHSEARQ